MSSNDPNDLNTLLSYLHSLALPIIEARWFSGAVVNIDGYHFKSCRFDNCILAFETGNFQLTACYLGEGTTVQYPLNTVRAIKLYNHIASLSASPPFAPQHHDSFLPTYHADGTLSVP